MVNSYYNSNYMNTKTLRYGNFNAFVLSVYNFKQQISLCHFPLNVKKYNNKKLINIMLLLSNNSK